MKFHNLAFRTDMSIGESTAMVKPLVEKCAELGHDVVAISDTMTISNMVALTQACEKKGLRPIIGVGVRVYDDPTYRKPAKKSGEKEKPNDFFRAKVYPTTQEGLKALFVLLSKANSEEYFYYHSRVGVEDLLQLKDCIITTGDHYPLVRHKRAKEIAMRIAGQMPLYAELTLCDSLFFDNLNRRTLALAEELDLPVIASRPVFYVEDDGADALDAHRAICSSGKLTQSWSPIPQIRDYSVKSPGELSQMVLALVHRLIDAPGIKRVAKVYQNLEAILSQINCKFEQLKPSLPVMAEDEFGELKRRCVEGFKKRLETKVLGYQPSPELLKEVYVPRLKYELEVIGNMGFSGYFLLVQDIVVWSKQNGVYVGAGRGSVGGSLIAYILDITDVDPIRFNLIFERFINPSRLDLPDADLDFQSSRRADVIEYIVNKYGRENVAGISNYSTLASASALRSVSRVFDLPVFEYDCSKLMIKEHGVSLSLEESAEQVPEIDKFRQKYPGIWKISTQLEGAMRTLGQHAAGIVVAGEPVVNRAVIETRTGGAVVNWDKTVVESFGLIKMDILGLSTLDVLGKAFQYIKERHKKTINPLSIPLDDPKVLQAFARGDTAGVFQFESGGMRKLLKEMGYSDGLTFDDITAATALFRPGPIDAGLMDDFVRIKQGTAAIRYDHPNMEAALKETYGVIVYQEQVMQVCRDLCGFTMAESDNVRKAIGKKDREKMAAIEEKFIKGAFEHSGMGEFEAKILWDKIVGFAGYAFNKSHSVEYTITSYLCMWLKVYYTAEFFAATLSVQDDDEKLKTLITDARKAGIEVMPPDINHSSNRIEVRDDKSLVAPFQAVKGISENVSNYIMQTKKKHGKPFESYADFVLALEAAGLQGKVNSRHRERLDAVGAFAEVESQIPALHPDRLRDRLEFMPGFTVDDVRVDREIVADEFALSAIAQINHEVLNCDKCPLRDCAHVRARIGKTPKFMMVFESPTPKEGNAGQMLDPERLKQVSGFLKDAGLHPNDGYYTALVKAPKAKGAKAFTNEQINACSEYLKREVEALKPPVIVTMGSGATKFFNAELKGAPADLAGKAQYMPHLDATLVVGLNPAMLFFDPSKEQYIKLAMQKVASLINPEM